MHQVRCVVLLAIAAVCAGLSPRPPARSAGPADWRSLVGCYRSGDWEVALDSIPFAGVFSHEDDARLARSSTSTGRATDTYWRVIQPDSVQIVFNSGLHGSTYRLAVREDTLDGFRQVLTDLPIRTDPTKVRAVREPCPPPSSFATPLPDSALQALLFGYAGVRPDRAALEADPWRAVLTLRTWLQANPKALSDWNIRWNARDVFERAANIDVRRNARELTGTYRLEIGRTDGPDLVFYGRTEAGPWNALRLDTGAVIFDGPAGYRLRFTLSRDSSSLPQPGPGRRHRNAFGDRGPSNSYIDVQLPATTSADGTRRFSGSVLLVNFTDAFRAADRKIVDWNYEWFHLHYREDRVPNAAEFVLSPDGRVTFTQREELGPGRAVVLRGERISGTVWECSADNC